MVKNSLQWLQWSISYDATILKNMVKLDVPTWSVFAGPLTYVVATYMN